jgi:prophage DNA circulation protein
MALLDELLPASFRGIGFLIESASTSGGAKIVTHEYPNDDRRYDENLGKLQKIFNVRGIISGENYFNRRDILLDALEDGSIGLLIHPYYGTHLVVPKPYTVEESNSRLGEAVISMIFEVSSPAVNPSQSSNFFPFISDLTGTSDTSLQEQIVNVFEVSKNFTRNFTAAQSKLETLSSTFDAFSNFYGGSNDTNTLTATQTSFDNSIVTYINDASELAAGISNLFYEANNVNDSARPTGEAMQQLFDFGDTDAEIPILNPETEQRYLNNTLINYITQTYSLIYAYNNYSQGSYTDTADLNGVKSLLEAQYQKIISGIISDGNNNFSANDILGDDVLSQLQQIRAYVKRQFDALEVSIDKVTNITVASMPAAIISYLYYGDTTQAERIIALNNISDVSFVSGNILALIKANDGV